jgi:hypothetical protein
VNRERVTLTDIRRAREDRLINKKPSVRFVSVRADVGPVPVAVIDIGMPRPAHMSESDVDAALKKKLEQQKEIEVHIEEYKKALMALRHG